MGKMRVFDVKPGGTFSKHWAVNDNQLEEKNLTYMINKNSDFT